MLHLKELQNFQERLSMEMKMFEMVKASIFLIPGQRMKIDFQGQKPIIKVDLISMKEQ